MVLINGWIEFLVILPLLAGLLLYINKALKELAEDEENEND